MVNPFDRNFFRFFVGFVSILCISFAILFIVAQVSESNQSASAAVER